MDWHKIYLFIYLLKNEEEQEGLRYASERKGERCSHFPEQRARWGWKWAGQRLNGMWLASLLSLLSHNSIKKDTFFFHHFDWHEREKDLRTDTSLSWKSLLLCVEHAWLSCFKGSQLPLSPTPFIFNFPISWGVLEIGY